MFFGIFVLNRVLILSIFVLNRVSFLRQEPITLFLDDKEPALMFYECLKLGIKNRNSVLNRVGKSATFVLNRVRVWGAEPHLPTQGYIEYPPRECSTYQQYRVVVYPYALNEEYSHDFFFYYCKLCLMLSVFCFDQNNYSLLLWRITYRLMSHWLHVDN